MLVCLESNSKPLAQDRDIYTFNLTLFGLQSVVWDRNCHIRYLILLQPVGWCYGRKRGGRWTYDRLPGGHFCALHTRQDIYTFHLVLLRLWLEVWDKNCSVCHFIVLKSVKDVDRGRKGGRSDVCSFPCRHSELHSQGGESMYSTSLYSGFQQKSEIKIAAYTISYTLSMTIILFGKKNVVGETYPRWPGEWTTGFSTRLHSATYSRLEELYHCCLLVMTVSNQIYVWDGIFAASNWYNLFARNCRLGRGRRILEPGYISGGN